VHAVLGEKKKKALTWNGSTMLENASVILRLPKTWQ
jgi:hypothetical protein